jgi:hypothetical protein
MLHEEVLHHFQFNLSTFQHHLFKFHLVIYGPMNSAYLAKTREHNLWHDAVVWIHARKFQQQLFEEPGFEHLAVAQLTRQIYGVRQSRSIFRVARVACCALIYLDFRSSHIRPSSQVPLVTPRTLAGRPGPEIGEIQKAS